MARLGRPIVLLLACGSCGPPTNEPGRTVIDVRVEPRASASEAPPATPADPEVARCDAGEVAACVKLANRCDIGAKGDVPWESTACAERERRACDAGETSYCRKLADRYTDVTNDVGVPKDEAIAAKLLEKACDGAAGFDSCEQLAHRYLGGIGVAVDVARAFSLFERVCDEESGIFPQPCQQVARLLIEGKVVKKDEARAARIHAATCAQGVCDVESIEALCADAGGKGGNAGCVPLARVYTLSVYGAPGIRSKVAKDLLERACKRRDAAGCRELANWYAEGVDWSDGLTIKPDATRARALLKQACDAGDEAACAKP